MSAVGLDLLAEPIPTPRLRPMTVRPEHPLGLPLRDDHGAGRASRTRASGLAGRPLDAWTLATELADRPRERWSAACGGPECVYRTADRLVMTSRFFGSYVWQLATAALGC